MLWLLLVSWGPELGFGGQPLFPHYEPLTDRLSEEAQPLAYLTEGGPRQGQGGCPSPGLVQRAHSTTHLTASPGEAQGCLLEEVASEDCRHVLTHVPGSEALPALPTQRVTKTSDVKISGKSCRWEPTQFVQV